MTCIDKLKELRPWLKDLDAREYVERYCPSEFGIMKNRKDCHAKYEECVACWGREVDEKGKVDIPLEFEYSPGGSIKLHCKTLEKFTHFYTHKHVYKVRICDPNGGIGDFYYSDNQIREMLACRVVEE